MFTKLASITHRMPSILFSLTISAILMAGCNPPSAFSATPTTIPTNTSLPLVETSTPIPTSPSTIATVPATAPAIASATATATETAAPTATTALATTNIVFVLGSTAAVEQRTIQPGQIRSYTISAGQAQPMILILSSPHNDVTLAVYEPNGNVLLDPAKKWTYWQWLLPKTELYTIQVIGGAYAESYTLTVKVAARINFALGAYSGTVNGYTPEGYVISYVVGARANQTMTVILNVPGDSAYLDIFGLASGQLLLSPSAKATSWGVTLPSTQDYIIEIIPKNGQVVNYSLTVTIN